MKRNHYKYQKVKVPIYVGKIHIVITDCFAGAQRKFFGEDCPKVVQSEAVVQEATCGHQFVFFRPGVGPGTIAHEAKHITNNILRYCSVPLSLQEDEAECFLLGWVVEALHKTINRKKLKTKRYD